MNKYLFFSLKNNNNYVNNHNKIKKTHFQLLLVGTFYRLELSLQYFLYQMRSPVLISALQFHTQIKVRLRSSHRRCSVERGVLRNFAKFTGKHLCQTLAMLKCLTWPSLKFASTTRYHSNLRNIAMFSTEHLQTTVSEASKTRIKNLTITYL